MLKNLFGDPNARKLRSYAPLISDINLLEEDFAPLTDDELRSNVNDFRQKLENESDTKNQLILLDKLLPQAFALVT